MNPLDIGDSWRYQWKILSKLIQSAIFYYTLQMTYKCINPWSNNTSNGNNIVRVRIKRILGLHDAVLQTSVTSDTSKWYQYSFSSGRRKFHWVGYCWIFEHVTDIIEFHRPTSLYILYEQTKRVVGTKLMRITYTFCFLSTVTCIYVLNKIFQIEETLKHVTIAYWVTCNV